MAKHISIEDIVNGVIPFYKKCIQNNFSFSQQLEYSNGKNTADMQNILFNSNIDLFLKCVDSMNIGIREEDSHHFKLGYLQSTLESGFFDKIVCFAIILLSKYKIISQTNMTFQTNKLNI